MVDMNTIDTIAEDGSLDTNSSLYSIVTGVCFISI
jgi:hypothetical protein